MPFTSSSIVVKTRQAWKLYLGSVLTIICGIAMFKGFQGAGNPILAVGGMVVGLATFVGTWFTIRCPNCRAPWVWMAVSAKKHNQWAEWLYALKACPKCGYDVKPK